jgi:hypothetical protein
MARQNKLREKSLHGVGHRPPGYIGVVIVRDKSAGVRRLQARASSQLSDEA